ncbi:MULTISPECIES: glycosyltransferase [Gordonia]|uniref:glycosyltransferase n=1 Tax=Gordonia TaxID=2053 RepID=UPI0021ACAC5E|nr:MULTISPECIES: glycosyltransferase [Gordonia]MCR8898510.1 glycosyltransferase [Gordonia sp. GONU]MCZ4652065.1 glycosyltransferase [Gordonia amicalis]MDJ0452851.1 glycosyltransferase [Gordonia amicalis]MDV7075455.1 glycosyltransferase [Gordonia amicalis]
MKVAIVIIGTRGDAQPGLVLAHALVERGHDVRIGLPPNTINDVMRQSLDVRPLGVDSRAHMEKVRRIRRETEGKPIRRMRDLGAAHVFGWDQLVDDMATVVDGADVIVTGYNTEVQALAYAEAAGVPLVSIHHAPVRRNRRVAPFIGRLPARNSAAVLANWLLFDAVTSLLGRRRENRLRAQLGLPKVSRQFATRMKDIPGVELQAYDPMFAIRDDPTWDGDSRIRRRPAVGFIELPADLRPFLDPQPDEPEPGDDLMTWLDAGDDPLYVGFGSMPMRGEKATLDAFLTVARRLGRRLLICAGWTDLSAEIRAAAESDDVRIESHVDHATVFPRCAVVVHHGGAGTTAVALRSATPSLICWYMVDQPFWGEELERLGIGASMPMTSDGVLDPDRIEEAIISLLDPGVAERARRVSEKLTRAGDTVTYAVDEIERQVGDAAARGAGGASAGSSVTRLERLATDDALYWIMTPALGWSVVLQIVWVLDDEISPEALTAMNTALSRGPLHRILKTTDVYGARPRWERAPDAPPPAIDALPVAESDIDTWAADEMATVPLDVENGRCWRLRAARTESGGTVVSLCALHVATDGRGMLAAAAEAAAASGAPLDPATGGVTPRPGNVPDAATAASRSRRRLADVADACVQVGEVARGLVRAVVEQRRSVDVEPDPRPDRPPLFERSPNARFTYATATVPTDVWERVAAEHGGTSNTMFIAAVSGLLRSSGFAPRGVPIKVGVPVDQREGDDERRNAIAGVSVYLADEPVAGGDLGGIRGACKAAFVRLSEGRRAPHIHLNPLIWFLPTSLLLKVAGAGAAGRTPDAMVSNLGDVPAEAMEIGGRPVRRIALRGMAQGVDPTTELRFGDGVQSWLLRSPEQVTFSVLGCDESHFPDDGTLRDLLDRELDSWDIPHHIW